MTKVFIKKRKGFITSFELRGHAGYDVEGKDIVCAAISMATQMAIMGIREVAGQNIEGTFDIPGYMRIILKNPKNHDVMIIANTLEMALETLAYQYPQNLQVCSY